MLSAGKEGAPRLLAHLMQVTAGGQVLAPGDYFGSRKGKGGFPLGSELWRQPGPPP